MGILPIRLRQKIGAVFKYKGTKKYLFDDFTNTEINKALKDVEAKLKSGKKLTYHVSR